MSNALGLANPLAQFFANDGTPLAGGLVYTYAATTTTPQPTFTDAALSVQNTNPIVLDAYGKCVMYLSPVNYKIDVQTPAGVSTDGYPRDNIAGSPFTSTLTVAQGGTGVVTLAAHGVIVGEGTTTSTTTQRRPRLAKARARSTSSRPARRDSCSRATAARPTRQCKRCR